jgi:hypothetical protein
MYAAGTSTRGTGGRPGREISRAKALSFVLLVSYRTLGRVRTGDVSGALRALSREMGPVFRGSTAFLGPRHARLGGTDQGLGWSTPSTR